MADEKTTFELDLDNKEFLKRILESKRGVMEIGDASNLDGLISAFKNVGPQVAIIGTALLGLKTTIDLVFDGEKIEATNKQFDVFSKNAGIAGDQLKEKLVKSLHGLADETDALQAANKALIELGSSAQRIPEVMELARKVTKVFGGDLVENFEKINHAVATGQTRQLKHMGILVDTDKAYKDYAKSIGVSVTALSEEGKQQALMNAVLEKGNKSFGTATDGLNKNATAWTQLKVAVKDAYDLLAEIANKIFGGTMHRVLKGTADDVEILTAKLKAAFSGDQKDQISATEKEVERLHDQIKKMNADMEIIAKGDPASAAIMKQQITQLEKTLAKKEEMLDEYYAKQQKKEAHAALAGGGTEAKESPDVKQNAVDQQKKLEQETAFNKSLLKMKEERLRAQQELDQTDEQVYAHFQEEKALKTQEYLQKVEELRVQYQVQGQITEQQYNLAREQLAMEHNAKMSSMEDELQQKRLKAIDEYQNHATNAADGMAKGFMASSRRAAIEVQQFGKFGAKAFDMVHRRASDMFIAMGEGSQDAGELMKGFMFNSLADIAEAQGRMLLASVLVNPANGAAGAALLVLSGILRSQAKGAKSSGIGGEGGGGGGFGESYSGVEGRPEAQMKEKKTVSINVQGSYFETDQTKQRLVEMIREHTDATDFQYRQVGK